MRLSQEPIFSAADIKARVTELGAEISRDYAGRPLTIVAVLKGAAAFSSDLMRAIDMEHKIEYVRARSYAGTQSTGHVEWLHLPEKDLLGRHVLVAEDILDTGRTLHDLQGKLGAMGVASVSICALLDKPSRRILPIAAQYVGFTIEDQFVVGYGLDHNERYRHLDAIYGLEVATD